MAFYFFFMISFTVQRYFSLISSHLFIFALVGLTLESDLKISCQERCQGAYLVAVFTSFAFLMSYILFKYPLFHTIWAPNLSLVVILLYLFSYYLKYSLFPKRLCLLYLWKFLHCSECIIILLSVFESIIFN